MPPDECRSEGTPSLSEGPDARGETFWFLLGRLPKGTRRKGETASRRYRRNGYVHPKENGRLPGRHRKQAHSHNRTAYIRRNQAQFPTMKPAFPPLPHRHTRLTSTQWKICPNPPQVEGLDYRHSTNRANTPGNSISANPQANSPVLDCPFDCHHRIANTHGNLMLPARNKE
ncbi:hypothetical protein FBY04_13629 [Pseudomonas sp. SJZ080]|nr:hypothetical protein FBY04_13629 [Pseudomonas sp. SJZ080]